MTLALLALLAACHGGADTGDGEVVLTDAELARALAASPRPAPPPDPTNAVAEDPDAAHLGQFLYFDTRLSADGQVACATCHDPTQGFGDGLQLAEGQGTTARHAPTVWDTVYNRWYFWDGRADSHWAQAAGPLEASGEHGYSRCELAHLMADDPELAEAYANIFGPLPDLSDLERFPAAGRPVPGDPEHPHARAWAAMTEADQDTVTQIFVNAVKCIAAYERKLIAGEAPFDRYVADLTAGVDSTELSAEAQVGLKIFMGEGNCHFCHSGPTFTDKEFHNIGLGPREWLDAEDEGRYAGVQQLLDNPFNAASRWSDDPEGASAERLSALQLEDQELLGRFKTPTLRNVAESAPYMHGGQFLNLEEVVHHYDLLEERPAVGHREDLMLPLELSIDEVFAVVAFLESLTGDPVDEALLVQPESPVR
ncbi:MAG: hypothetical protein H6740_25870 [Alphaproteobacteria bacterium]|nr:hypothetical protein [Alphaproteobacteria bacterium]